VIDAASLEDAIALLDCGLDRPRRLRDCVFVLHIGDDPFFEWIVVPRCDASVPNSSSLSGLPPNERPFFILKQFPLYAQDAIERSRRLSTVFRLVADGFADIETR
jgi:hypothetical protein